MKTRKSIEWLQKAVTSQNIADDLTDEELSIICSDCDTGYKEDKASRAEWETRQEEYMKLAIQVREAKNKPWDNASNVKYPLLTTATMQFGARAYPGLVTGPSIAKGRVTGFDPTGAKAMIAERVGKHMSYQLIEEMEDWEEDMDKLCISIPIVAMMFKKTYFSPSKGRNCSELIYPKDLVVNYWAKSLKDAPRITHVIPLSENDVYERIQSGIFLDDDYTEKVRQGNLTSNEVHGTSEPAESEFTPLDFFEQHTYLDLDGDGYKEPYIVTFNGSKIARIVACFDLEGVVINNKNKVVRIERIEYFTKYGFIPNPDGSFYDIGYGNLLAHINESINTATNQLFDAGTASNGARGFIARGVRLRGKNSTLGPFEWKEVQTSGDDLRKGIVRMDAGQPSLVLFQLLGFMVDAGKDLANTIPMLMGQNPGQNQPATTSMAVIEQGLKVFSSIFKRMHRSLKQELKKLHRLNRIYLPPESYFQVLDVPDGEAKQIFQSDYSTDMTDVQPYSDPNIVADVQRMIKAQQVMEMMKNNMIPNPAAGAKLVLEAMDLPDIEALLTPPQESPPPELVFEIEKQKTADKIKWAELMLKAVEIDQKGTVNETSAVLNLAKAEAAEAGSQIKMLESQIAAIQQKYQIADEIMAMQAPPQPEMQEPMQQMPPEMMPQ